MRKLLYLIPLVVTLSCHHKQAATVLVLDKSQLFMPDSVQQFLSALPADQSDSSKKLFLQGIDLFRNKNNPISAIESFVTSLMILPNASGYYELGNVYLENKQLPDALKAYEMAEKMNYSPWSTLLFKKASVFAAMENMDSAFTYISFAVENGFVDRSRIMNDPHFLRYKNDPWLVTIYNQAMSGNGDPEEILWQSYSRGFDQAKFPFVLDSGSFRKMGEVNYVSYDYEGYIPEMRDGKFSRDVGNEFFYVARLWRTPAYTSVIYGCQSYEEASSPVQFILAIFSNKGKLLDKKVVAGSKAFDMPYLEVKFKTATEFQVQEYINQYAKSTENDGYDNNPIVQRQLKSTQDFEIDAAGKIHPKS
jgi:tetratricopeptide (TPR) repeat protein